MKSRQTTASWLILGLLGLVALHAESPAPGTFCNPLDLDYRFEPHQTPAHREAADPLVVVYQGEYWIFASASGGYWHSPDFQKWTFVPSKHLPIDDYAPAVAIINGKLYYTAFGTKAIYRGDNPATDLWTKVAYLKGYRDPDLFQDDDGRVYMYSGCSYRGSIDGVELDPAHQFIEKGKSVKCLTGDPQHRGWEVFGETNQGAPPGDVNSGPWIEGAWMTKHDGKYYLQYSAPATQLRTYADGVFVGDHPLGPFTYQPYSPFSHKPTGFAAGAGHSGTFQDKLGNWWHISSMTISMRQRFERRLGVFPAGFLPDGQMVCDTRLGDYPQYLPGTDRAALGNTATGWMLLSYRKPAQASSTRAGFSVAAAFDEDIRTWWCARTGNPGEWLKVDLGKPCTIRALQMNFADEGAHDLKKLRGDAYQYIVESSTDGSTWRTILDRHDNQRDAPDEYASLPQPVTARYVRLTNIRCPNNALFSLSGFRIFGNAPGSAPSAVSGLQLAPIPSDARKATVSWTPSPGTDFYIIRYGLAPDRLYQNYQVGPATHYQINALNTGFGYYFTIDAVNASGCTKGTDIAHLSKDRSPTPKKS